MTTRDGSEKCMKAINGLANLFSWRCIFLIRRLLGIHTLLKHNVGDQSYENDNHSSLSIEKWSQSLYYGVHFFNQVEIWTERKPARALCRVLLRHHILKVSTQAISLPYFHLFIFFSWRFDVFFFKSSKSKVKVGNTTYKIQVKSIYSSFNSWQLERKDKLKKKKKEGVTKEKSAAVLSLSLLLI